LPLRFQTEVGATFLEGNLDAPAHDVVGIDLSSHQSGCHRSPARCTGQAASGVPQQPFDRASQRRSCGGVHWLHLSFCWVPRW
jgi:hypothetical protein